MNRSPDRFTALLDACVLAGALHRNMLLSLAEEEFFRCRWSARILDETQKAIARITKDATNGARQREKIEAAFPEALVTGYEIFEDELGLPDPNDNHVLAAAISISASVIVTDNLKDFPAKALASHGLEAVSSDEFIANTIELDPSAAFFALKRMRKRFENPALDAAALIRRAEARGLFQTATMMDKYQSWL